LRFRTSETVFGINNITIAFVTTKDLICVRQIREWKAKEFTSTHESNWLANHFPFTAFSENIENSTPKQLFLDPVMDMPSDNEKPVSLLEE
jgi:hypothetical protein